MEEFPRFNRTSEEIATIQLQLWETALPDKAFYHLSGNCSKIKVVAAQLEEQEKAPFLTVDNAQTAVALTIQVLLGFGFLFLAFLLAIICWKKSAIFL